MLRGTTAAAVWKNTKNGNTLTAGVIAIVF
jgi:hypothetical protein